MKALSIFSAWSRSKVHPIKEEVANIFSASVGLLFSVAAFGILIALAAQQGGPLAIFSASIYGMTMLVVYVASIMLHGSVAVEARFVKAFRIIDHCAIYLLIAGTYTPFALISLNGTIGWSLFGVIWGMAVLGIIHKVFFPLHSELLSTVIYIVMGWIAIVAIKPLAADLGAGGTALLFGGGVLYSVGAIFFLVDRKLAFAHAIWHFFVLGGSVLHFCAVILYVLPKSV